MGRGIKNTPESFWAKVDKKGDCWFYPTDKIRWGGRVMSVRRIAYELTNSPVADKVFILSTCGIDDCINPSHLQCQTPEIRFWSKVEITDTCWNWVGNLTGTGYGVLSLGRDNRTLAHRMSYELQYGDIPDNLLVCHTCDNRVCVRPTHLFLGTHKDNTQDMVRKGRGVSPPGEGNGGSVLTLEQVIRIREEYATGNTSYPKLAVSYSISDTTIGDIITRKTWKHIS